MTTPIVLVHGLATSSARTWGDTGWLDLIGDAGQQSHPIDILGHGTADKPTDPEAFDHLEEWFVEQLPDGPLRAVGFSMGARLLLSVASTHPDRFEKLVVAGVGANLFVADQGRGSAIAAAIAGTADPEDPEAAHFHALADAPDVDRGSLVALMSSTRPPLTPESLKRIGCPVLVVLGDGDFAGPADPLVAALPDATLVTLRNTDHFSTPKSFSFIEAALDFLGAAPF